MSVAWIIHAALPTAGGGPAARIRAPLPRLADVEAALPRIEAHGVLGLVLRNLRASGLAVESPRERALLAADCRVRLTTERVAGISREAGIPVILLKGASLAEDLYPEPGLRNAADLDILVRRSELRALLGALAARGFAPPPGALPLLWHRAFHFHAKLAPPHPLLAELEVHWALHHPALGLAVREEALWSRAAAKTDGGCLHLDAADRLLHLATHLVSHAGDPRSWDPEAILSTCEPPLRWKWIADLVGVIELDRDRMPPLLLRERAGAWNAGSQLEAVLRFLLDLRILEPDAEAWARAALPFPGTVGRWRSGREASGQPAAGLDFRLGTLARLPAYLVPSPALVARTHGAGRLAAILIAPLLAAGRMLRVLGAGLSLPLAVLLRPLLRGRRQSVSARGRTPDATLELAAAWRRLGGPVDA